MFPEKFAKKEILGMSISATQKPVSPIHDLINLGSGDPDFNQPKYIVDAVANAMRAGYTHYCFGGDPDFREAIARYYKRLSDVDVDPFNDVNICAGGSQGIFQALGAIVNPGDEVITLDPTYTGYKSPIQFLGGKMVRAEMKKDKNGYFSPDIEKLEEAISKKTKALIICNPNNPTGSNYSEKEIQGISRLSINYDFAVISDEIYDQFIWGDGKFVPIITQPGMWERTIVVMSLSKTFAMTGCRVGFIISNSGMASLIKRVPVGSQTVPTPFQKAAAVALNGKWDFVDMMRAEFHRRLEYSVKRLNEIQGISCVFPKATFYLFPDITKTGLASKEFEIGLKEDERLQIRSGANYGAMGEGYIRIALVRPMEIIEEAMNRIERFIKRTS